MAIATTALPYGLREVKVYPLVDGTDAFSTGVKLPNSQTFSFSEAEEFTELRGDDTLVAIRGKGPKIEWSLESGGISLAAYVVMVGGTLSLTGITPNQIRKINLHVGVRSEQRSPRTNDYVRNHLTTVVSVRSLAYVSRYP